MEFLINLISGFVKPEMFKKQIGSAVRHLLSFLSGYLTLLGLHQEQIDLFITSANPIILAAIMYGLSQAWSFVEKAKREEVKTNG